MNIKLTFVSLTLILASSVSAQVISIFPGGRGNLYIGSPMRLPGPTSNIVISPRINLPAPLLTPSIPLSLPSIVPATEIPVVVGAH